MPLLVLLLSVLVAGPAVPPGPVPVPPASVAAPTDGGWPLSPAPEVRETFQPPSSPYGPGHRGVDLVGRPGQRVLAPLPGRVTYAGVIAGRGVVVVDHGPTRTTYEPVAARVTVGQEVRRGEMLGTLQPFGSHCAPEVCLHWGLIEGDDYLDPLTLVGRAPVRLLPLGAAVTPSG